MGDCLCKIGGKIMPTDHVSDCSSWKSRFPNWGKCLSSLQIGTLRTGSSKIMG